MNFHAPSETFLCLSQQKPVDIAEKWAPHFSTGSLNRCNIYRMTRKVRIKINYSSSLFLYALQIEGEGQVHPSPKHHAMKMKIRSFYTSATRCHQFRALPAFPPWKEDSPVPIG